MVEDKLSELYCSYSGHRPDSVVLLPGAGSNRRYYRLGPDPSLIGVAGTSRDENEAFIYLSKHFSEKGLPVPRVYGHSDDMMIYIQDDLGSSSLFDFIAPGRLNGEWNDGIVSLLEKTVRVLPDFQWKGAEGLDFSRCYPVDSMNKRAVMWDLNYFKYYFLKTSGVEFDEDKLEDDFDRLASYIVSLDTGTFMYRDFQSRNVMTLDGQPWFIDFQGGRRGPYHYDIVSFLWQAKANFPDWLRERLLDVYIESASRYIAIDKRRFDEELRYVRLLRILQVLGAYGFRGRIERKPHFLQSIPKALENLRELLTEPLDEYAYLNSVLNELVKEEASDEAYDGLTVKVASFGFRKHGIPEDNSGNGGGFVFDCRAIHNPGRYDDYKSLTGLDREVIEFLEREDDMHRFLEHAFALVDASVERYIKRGFQHLMVSFGCTGGQHRSVYSAERMARHLHEKYNVRVVVDHVEQNMHKVINPEQINR